MEQNQDWRLQGQEKYLKNKTLYFRKYKVKKKRWDHDHCEFCFKKFSEDKSDPECLNEGYTTSDYYRWICQSCFDDFKNIFDWIVCQE